MSRSSLLRAALALLVLGVVAGCGAPLPGAGPAPAKRRPLEPRLDATTPLVLERLGRRLKVGDDAAVAAEVFPKPVRAFVFNELPERLSGDFDSRGWESRDEGFGAILYGGRVAVAMRQFYAIDATRYDELLQTIRGANRRVKSRGMNGENVEFTFWETEPQVLMVLRRGLRQNAYDLTIALGDRSVMEALEMTPAKVQGILDRLEGNPVAATPGKPPVKAPTPRAENAAPGNTPPGNTPPGNTPPGNAASENAPVENAPTAP